MILRTYTPHPVASAADELLCLNIDPWEEHDGNWHAARLAVLYISAVSAICVLALSERCMSLELDEPFHFDFNWFVFAFKYFSVIQAGAWGGGSLGSGPASAVSGGGRHGGRSASAVSDGGRHGGSPASAGYGDGCRSASS